MAFLKEADRARVEAAVARAERQTGGEFVTALTPASGSYNGVRIGVPALIALAVPFVALAAGWTDDAILIAQIQLGVFALLALAFQWTPLALAFVPASIKQANAERECRAQFQQFGIHTTADRAGVLLFVSIAEHYVEILADRGIADRVDPAAWQAIVDRFIADVRAGRVADGYEAAIEGCSALVARHFPRSSEDRNELPDRHRQV